MGKRYLFANSGRSELLGKRVVEFFHRNLPVVVVVKHLHQRVLLVVCYRNVHAAQTFCELIEVNKLVVVFVELFEEVNRVRLEVGVVSGGGLDLTNDSLDGSFGEDIAVVLHVLLSVIVR